MARTKYLFLLLAGLVLPFSLYAQFMDYGADPSRFKWNIVRLPHYKLIYPQGNDSIAYRYALYLEGVYPHLQQTMGKPVKASFPVVLHPGNMSSNGMVAWAPRRMELITTPSSSLDVQSWDKHLVLHESRHVYQTGKIMQGIAKPLYYLIGEQAAGIASCFVPIWFLEGDAVGTETAMSNGGRGRLAEFNMPYRAQMLSGKPFYLLDKWLLGSYKDYTGDYYALGYNLTSYARQRYGADVWDKTTSRYARNFYFPKSFKKTTGSSIKGLYHDTYDYLRKEWEKQDTANLTPAYHSPVAKSYTSYRYPQAVNDSVIIAVKSGLKDINALVTLVNGKEKRLTYIGNLNSRLTLRNNRIYWTEIVSGLRWTHENYSVLKCYDLNSKRLRILTPRQRYLSPAIDKEGETIAVSSPTVTGKNQLVLLDKDGNEQAIYPTPNNAFIKELTFGDAGTIIALAVTDRGNELLQFDTHSKEWNSLLYSPSVSLASPVWKDGRIYFQSGANGINNIYYLQPSDGQVYRSTASRFGAFDPAFLPTNDNRLLFSDYQATGYRVASLPVDSLLSEKTDLLQPVSLPFTDTLAAQEKFNLDSAALPDTIDFQPKRYRKGPHTFKIHSWAPIYYDVAEAMNASASDLSTIVKPGAMILSQNTLNTAIMQAGWYYEDGYHHGKATFTYQGWFPVINLAADYGGRSFDVAWARQTDEEGKQWDVAQGYYTKRTLLEAEARIYLPLNLTRGHYIRGIQPAFTYYITNDKYQEYGKKKFHNFQYILPEILFYRYRTKAKRDILPRSGYQLRLQYLKTPFNSENYGSLYAVRLTTYWPGLIRNHGLMLRAGYQYQQLDNKALYLPKHLLESPRGYHFNYQTRQQWAFKGDYALPLLSPDLSIGPLIYIRRVRANLFYDLSRNQASKNSKWTTQSSYGGDIIFDWNVFGITYPLTTGVRLIQPIDYGKFQAEVLFSITF